MNHTIINNGDSDTSAINASLPKRHYIDMLTFDGSGIMLSKSFIKFQAHHF